MNDDWDGTPGSEEDLVRRQEISWTREDVDRYLEAAGLDLPDWQRAIMIAAGNPQIGSYAGMAARRTGKRQAYQHTRNLAIALGYKVTDLPHGCQIEVPE